MAFPGTSLDLLVEAYPGQWVDLSDRLTAVPVSIPQRGAPNGSRSTAAGSCTVTLDDDDGALTPLNPSGAYYPHVRRGAPFRVAVRRLNDAFDRTQTAGWGTDWVSFAAGGTVNPSDSSVSSGQAVHSVPAALAYRANYYDAVSLADAEVRTVVEMPDPSITGGAVEPANIMLRLEDLSTYYLVRVSVDTSEVVTVALHHTVTGELAGAVSTGVVHSGQPIAVAGIVAGPWFAAKVWNAADPEPRDWQVEVVDHTYTGRGFCGVRSGVATGNSDTKPFLFRYNAVEIRAPRAAGTAASYRPAIVPRTDRTMVAAQTIEIGGLLRQLERGPSGARSAATRYTAASTPVAYWPLEDGVDSTQAASGLPGGSPLTVRAGIMDFVDDAPPGASGSAHPLPSAENALQGTITGASATSWQVSVWSKGQVTQAAEDGGLTAYYVPWEIVTTTGQVLRLAYQYEEDRAIGVAQWTSLSETSPANVVYLDDDVDPHTNPGITGEWIHVQFYAEQSGADTNAFLYVNGANVDARTWSGVTIGAPRDIRVMSPFGAGNATSLNVEEIWISQLAIHNGGFLVAQYQPGLGFPGELATDRAERVAAEEGVPIHVTPGPDDSAAMGVQPVASLLDVLRECEAADFGILGESRAGMALTYRAGSARVNPAVDLTVDLSTYRTTAGTSGSVLSPVYDDQGLRNDIEARRVNGSRAVALDQASIDADGRYDESVEVNVATDEQLPSVAHWMLNEGTVDEYRNPNLALDLGATPDLIDGWLSADHGSRVQRTNPPPPHPTGVIDQIISGYSESLGHRSWTATANCQPARPWDVAEVDGDQRVPADGSTLVADIDDTDTELLLASTIANGPWVVGDPIDAPDDFFMDVRVGGEVVSVASIEPSVVDTFSGSSTSGWAPADTGQTWSHPVGSGTDYPESAGTGRILMSVVNTLYSSVLDVGTPHVQYTVDLSLNVSSAPGASITLWVCAGWQGTNDYNFARLTLSTAGAMSLGLLRRNGGSLTTVSPSVTGTAHTSGDVWRVTWASDADRLVASMRNITTGAHTTWIDGPATDGATGTGIAILARRESGSTGGTITATVDNLTVASPQLVTVTSRGVNGVNRGWAAGTPIDVAEPAIVSL